MVPNRNPDDLAPHFKQQALAFLAEVDRVMDGFTPVIHETRRSPERQKHLFESGRSRSGPILTNTLRSKHLTGEALDWHFQRHGRAVWDTKLYEEAYRLVPPEKYGLKHLLPFEAVHVEWAGEKPTEAHAETEEVPTYRLMTRDNRQIGTLKGRVVGESKFYVVELKLEP